MADEQQDAAPKPNPNHHARRTYEERARACEMFQSGIMMKDIATELDIPFGTLKSWHTRYGWGDDRAEFLVAVSEQSRADLVKKMLNGASEFALKQHQIVRESQDELLGLLESIRDESTGEDGKSVSVRIVDLKKMVDLTKLVQDVGKDLYGAVSMEDLKNKAQKGQKHNEIPAPLTVNED